MRLRGKGPKDGKSVSKRKKEVGGWGGEVRCEFNLKPQRDGRGAHIEKSLRNKELKKGGGGGTGGRCSFVKGVWGRRNRMY